MGTTKLTNNQRLTLLYMHDFKPSGLNITDRKYYNPSLSKKQFNAFMKQLEAKEFVAKSSGRNGDYVYFEGWYITDLGKSIAYDLKLNEFAKEDILKEPVALRLIDEHNYFVYREGLYKPRYSIEDGRIWCTNKNNEGSYFEPETMVYKI